MQLSDTMRAELERRLAKSAVEQAADPAFDDLPRVDVGLLVGLVMVAIAGVFVLQAG